MSFRPAALGCALIFVLASCTSSPVEPAGSTTVTTPALASPANGATIANALQPVTLTVNNALITKSDAAVTYTFEVASDSAFATVVATKDVTQGTGQTSVKLDTLTPGRDYYWRARTKGDDTVGSFTAPLKFTIGPAVTLSAPVGLSPTSGSSTEQRPTLRVSNVTWTGPVGTLVYRFDISTSSTFATLLTGGTVAQGNGSTTFTPIVELSADATYFWRAQAVDTTNNITGPFSTGMSFTTTLSIDLTKVNYQRFVNISGWPVTNRIIAVDQDGGDGHMCINHEKRGLWPTVDFEDNPLVPVEATQWYFARINGQWYGGAGEWLRPNQICKEGQKSEDIGKDGTWGGPMDTWIPKRGELVGYMISTPARTWPKQITIDQRSNVVVQPWVVNGISTP
jgi:hypothetical protein